MTISYVTSHVTELQINWEQMHPADFSYFHAMSGCDTVSAFRGVGKKTAKAIWCSMSHLDHIFARLSHAPKQIFTEDLKQLERVVVLLHQRTTPSAE